MQLDTILWDKPTVKPRSRAYAAPLITFSRDVMSFNALFIKAAGLFGDNNTLRFQYVDVSTNAEHCIVGLRFHNELRHGTHKILCSRRKMKNGKDKRPDADAAYTLSGVRVKLGSVYTSVVWLGTIAREANSVNGAPMTAQFTPVFHSKTGTWIVQLQPTLGAPVSIGEYQKRLQGVDPFGVYAFYNGENKLIYVGEGRIATRLREHLRSGRFAIAEVRYCETDSKTQAKAMEDRILLTCGDLYGNGTFLNIKRT